MKLSKGGQAKKSKEMDRAVIQDGQRLEMSMYYDGGVTDY
jgi:hypothetical protein